MKKILLRLTESDLRNILKHSVKNVLREIYAYNNRTSLNEDKAGKREYQARKILKNKGLPNDQILQIYNELRETFTFLRSKEGVIFFPLIARYYVEGSIKDATAITDLNQTCQYILNNPKLYEKYDSLMNGDPSLVNLSFEQFINDNKQGIENWLSQEKERMQTNATEQTNGYTVVPIPTFDEAQKYAKYFPDDDSIMWCITYSEDNWNAYTGNGTKGFFFCLKNGFENVPCEKGENFPYDDYGLSMIAIVVDSDGKFVQGTLRWNHEAGAPGDNAFKNAEEVQNVIGGNFYELFDPKKDGIMSFDEKVVDAIKKLKNGVDPNDIFDDVENFSDGFAVVMLDHKWNFIDTKGNLLSKNQWFDDVYDFKDGFALVRLDDKWNLIDTKGNLIFNQWFDYVSNFIGGFALVRLDDKWNFIDTKGNIVSNQWFDYVGFFKDGFALVELNNKSNFIDTKGNIVSLTDCANIKLKNGVNPHDVFDDIRDFHDGYARVEINSEYNFIDAKGNILSKNKWFNYARDFYDGFAKVEINGEYNFINTNGNLISNQWFDYARNFNNDFAIIFLDDKGFNFIDAKGNIVSKNQWFYKVYDFHDGFAKVILNDKQYLLDTKGQLHPYNG